MKSNVMNNPCESISTLELVNELVKREGVQFSKIAPHVLESLEPISGPAIVLIVTD